MIARQHRPNSCDLNFRRELLRRRGSFVFETVFSDPDGEKVFWLREAVAAGYEVVLCFIGIDSPDVSQERVAMRVSQGGHDVPDEKLRARFGRTLANLARAIRELPEVRVYENSKLRTPYLHVATYQGGRAVYLADHLPGWWPL